MDQNPNQGWGVWSGIAEIPSHHQYSSYIGELADAVAEFLILKTNDISLKLRRGFSLLLYLVQSCSKGGSRTRYIMTILSSWSSLSWSACSSGSPMQKLVILSVVFISTLTDLWLACIHANHARSYNFSMVCIDPRVQNGYAISYHFMPTPLCHYTSGLYGLYLYYTRPLYQFMQHFRVTIIAYKTVIIYRTEPN